MKTLVIFLEEPSARAMLEGLLPRFLPDDVKVRFIAFEGKQDLEKQLIRKLSGWLAPNTCFLVLRDQDAGNCLEIKEKLIGLCHSAGKPQTLVRIACRELESWYFGDLFAVEKGLEIQKIAANRNKSKYRTPDVIVNPARELASLTKGKYQKISGSRAIGPWLDPKKNTSHSFRVFYDGVMRLLENC